MAEDPDEQAERFRQRYLTSGNAALIEAELEVLGGDYQGNGYTTMAQADHMGDLLDLAPGVLLLDLGAGCGWPGVYLATTSGCAVVSLDPIAEGLRVARDRSERNRIARRQSGLRGEATALPFRSGVFDAAIHGDVMC